MSLLATILVAVLLCSNARAQDAPEPETTVEQSSELTDVPTPVPTLIPTEVPVEVTPAPTVAVTTTAATTAPTTTPVPPTAPTVVAVTLTFEGDFSGLLANDSLKETLIVALSADIATSLGVDQSQVIIHDVRAGSLIVDFTVTGLSDDSVEAALTVAQENPSAFATANVVLEANGFPTASVASFSVVVVPPTTVLSTPTPTDEGPGPEDESPEETPQTETPGTCAAKVSQCSQYFAALKTKECDLAAQELADCFGAECLTSEGKELLKDAWAEAFATGQYPNFPEQTPDVICEVTESQYDPDSFCNSGIGKELFCLAYLGETQSSSGAATNPTVFATVIIATLTMWRFRD